MSLVNPTVAEVCATIEPGRPPVTEDFDTYSEEYQRCSTSEVYKCVLPLEPYFEWVRHTFVFRCLRDALHVNVVERDDGHVDLVY